MVKIGKTSASGAVYYLAAHSDTRNAESTWAFTQVNSSGDDDEYWNIRPWKQDGKTCYKIEKAIKSDVGRVLTAHKDMRSDSGNSRVLVRTAGHYVRDECWQFEETEENSYKIIKRLNRSKGMWLVANVERKSGSFWADVSSSDTDSSWELSNEDLLMPTTTGSGTAHLKTFTVL